MGCGFWDEFLPGLDRECNDPDATLPSSYRMGCGFLDEFLTGLARKHNHPDATLPTGFKKSVIEKTFRNFKMVVRMVITSNSVPSLNPSLPSHAFCFTYGNF